jgi:hypothetical protein
MSENIHHLSGNLLVGSSHFFVDTTNNRVGITTADPDAGLHVNSNAYVHTDFRVGSGIAMNVTGGRITAGSFDGDGSLLSGVNSDSGSWVNGSSSNIHLAVSTDKVGIGTVDPDGPLHLNLPATSNYTGFTYQSGDVKTVFGNTGDDSTNTSFVQVYAGVSSSVPDTNSGTYNLALQPHGGNVGIGGVLQPAETLDILGTLRIGKPNGPLLTDADGMLTIDSRSNPSFNYGNESVCLQTTIDGRTLAQGANYASEDRCVLALQPDFGYVGVGTVSPVTKLDVGGRIYGSGTVVQVRDRYMQSFWTTTSGSVSGDIPQSLETDVKWNITPTKTSSRILVNFKFMAYFASMNGYHNGARCQIWRKIGSTYSRVYGISGSYHDLHYYSLIQDHHAYIPISFVDSPGTTSVVEYALRARMYLQVGTMYIGNVGHQPITIQLMEIGG